MTRISSSKLFLLAVLILAAAISAGQKKPLDHSVYDSWKSARAGAFTRDGKWVSYVIAPQSGDGELFVRATHGEPQHKIARGTAQRFTYDGKFLLATVAPLKADTDKAKKEKKPPKDQPKNALAILDLSNGNVASIERVKSWRLAEKGSGWVAYQLEDPPTESKKEGDAKPAAAAAPPTGAAPKPAEPQVKPEQTQTKPNQPEQKKEDKPQKKKDHAAGSELILREIATGNETKIADVADYAFSEDGKSLLYAISTKDGAGDAIVLLDLPSGQKTTLMAGMGHYQLPAFSKKADRLAFVSDRDDYKSEQSSFNLYVYEKGWKEPKLLAKEGTLGIPKGWWITNRGNLSFSESGKRVMFNTAPKPAQDKKDDTPDDEKVSLDIWNYKDAPLMPVQLLQINQDRNRNFRAAAFLDSGRIVQLEDENTPNVTVGKKGDADEAFVETSEAYGVEASWDPGWSDLVLVDVRTGSRKRVVTRYKGNSAISPEAKYGFWFDGAAKAGFAIDLDSGKIVNLTKDIPYPVHEYDDDHPDLPGPFGYAGWIEGDKGVLVYDEFDVWLCDPTGRSKPICVTDGMGRLGDMRLRIIDTDPERDFYKIGEPLLLSAFNVKTKASGFYQDAVGINDRPKKLIWGDCLYTYAGKAGESNEVLFTRQRFDEYPNLWFTDLSFTNPQQITDANPQQKDYVWGKSELVEWISLDGIPLQGLLIKPEDFDPGKKYPMIVYFYERESDNLHRHRVPAPSASTINPTMFASNEYLVFIPDIPYKIGYPGESAVNAILPGVSSLLSRGYIDPKRLGVQGQSWGGYQTAFLITQTKIFAAAGAGAPVSNMFSAYGGIRWGSGLVRQMQYEHGQSRIGGTPWETPLRYMENSPLFFADKVQTPLLIMHNDKDGAVPWYQGIEYFTALRRLGKPVWLLVYNNEDHNLTRRPNQKDLSVRLQQFFDHYLKGAPEPVWMKDGVKAVDKGKTLGLEIPEEKKGGG